MATVYAIRDAGKTEPLVRVYCQDETRDLHRLLENNLDLLPGDQIEPENPRRWLLIKHEMPVPDPSTGTARWSLDFLLVDQDATPTFVECKRFADPRARREVIGQVLEYVANGHYYWTADELRQLAEIAVAKRGQSLDDALRALQPSSESPDTFFNQIIDNLREGQARIIFFLEDSPMELRSLVDFLNRQMERTEVLLVEARQYTDQAVKIVVPTLFGFTEQARAIKRSVTTKPSGGRRKWDASSFIAAARTRLDEATVQSMNSFREGCLAAGYEVGWGTGVTTGSFGIYDPTICPRSLITVWADGKLNINFGWFNGSEAAERGRELFKCLLTERTSLRVPDDFEQRFVAFPATLWTGELDNLLAALRDFLLTGRGLAS